MGDKKGPVKQPVVIKSRPFRIRTQLAHLDTLSDFNRHDPDVIAKVEFAYEPVSNRWLYVFQRLGFDILWIGEYWIDDAGNYYPADMSKSMGKERQDRQPVKEILAAGNKMEYLAFVHTSNGRRIYHSFWLSGSRLSLQSINDLQTLESWKIINILDLSIDATFLVHTEWILDDEDVKYGKESEHSSNDGREVYVPVMDALLHGMSLNVVMQQLRDIAVAFFVPTADLEPAQRDRTLRRQKKYLLARTLKSMMDHNSSVKKDLTDVLRPNEVDWTVEDYEKKSAKKRGDVDAAATHLAMWMDSKFMALAVKFNTALPGADPIGHFDDFAGFITEYAACMDRMMESKPGYSWLEKTVSNKSNFVMDLVMTHKEASHPAVKLFSKVPAPFYLMFKELFIPYYTKYALPSLVTKYQSIKARVPNSEIQIVPSTFLFDTIEVTYINKTLHKVTVSKTVGLSGDVPAWIPIDAEVGIRVSPEPADAVSPGQWTGLDPTITGGPDDPFRVTSTSGSDSSQGGSGPVDPNATQHTAPPPPKPGQNANPPGTGSVTVKEDVVLETIITKEPTHWSKGIPKDAVDRIQNAIQKYGRVLDAIKLGLALQDLKEQGFNVWNVLNAASALGKVLTGFEAALNLSSKSLRGIAVVTGVIDAVVAFHDASRRLDVGDTTAAGGYLVVGSGSAMIAIGAGLALFGVETAWTGVGLVAVAVGTLLVVFSGHTALQKFAHHCVFGWRHGLDSGSEPWSEGPFKDWSTNDTSGLDRQIKALFGLLAAYTLEREGSSQNLSLKVTLGMVRPESKLHINVDTAYFTAGNAVEMKEPRHIQSSLVLDLGSKRFVNTTGSDHSFNVTFGYSSNGNQVIEVRADFSPKMPHYGHLNVWQQDMQVRLDLQGDQSEWIPRSGKWVPFPVSFDMESMKVQTRSSIEY